MKSELTKTDQFKTNLQKLTDYAVSDMLCAIDSGDEINIFRTSERNKVFITVLHGLISINDNLQYSPDVSR